MCKECEFTREDRESLREIKHTVDYLKNHQVDCIQEFKQNRDTMEEVLVSLNSHLTKFGGNFDRLTDRIDRILSTGVVPIGTLNKIVLALIAIAGAFSIITLVFILGMERIESLTNIAGTYIP